ncbi:hypothetical protein L0Y59_05115, partial [Candidatus Uhrbacteria bacterium]|nr:hypothetical protein [Candidatus Uhrbacteria bacterium]
MSFRTIVCLVSLVVCTGLLAAPPAVTFDQTSAIVTLPAGHAVAWIKADGSSAVRSGLNADADSDGVVRITPGDTIYSTWIIADTETGEWTTTQPKPEHTTISEGGLMERTILPGPDGAYSQLYVHLQMRNGGALWIRPGVGAWTAPEYKEPAVLTRTSTFLIVDVSKLSPLGASGAAPDGFERGDVLLLVTSGFASTGVVDTRLDDPPFAGFVNFPDSYGGYVEGRESAVDIVRSSGTAGTVTVKCVVPADSQAPYAVAGIDYVPVAPQLLTFGPGETVKRCAFTLLDDGVYSEFISRYFRIMLTERTGTQPFPVPPTYQVGIIDDDPPPVITLESLPSSVIEGDTPWTLNVPWSLTGAFRGEIRIRFEAKPTDTYYDLLPEDRQRTTAIPIAADDVPSPARNIEVKLYPGLNGSRVQPVTRTITVLDDDSPPAPVVSLSATSPVEGDSGHKLVPVRVQLATALAAAVTVNVTSADATADAW